MQIVMPESFDKAIVKLNSRRLLSEFSTVRKWERAAMIAMMVENQGRGRPQVDGPYREQYSILEFSRLGIQGFKSPTTIALYLSKWKELGLPAPRPGDTVEIPVHDPGEIKKAFGGRK